jgi:hypothetical protein
MKTTTLMIVLVAAFAFCLVGCKKGGGGATPEDAVKGMMDATKAKNYEKAVSFIDVEAMVAASKKMFEKMTKDMPAEEKKKMEKEMADQMDVAKVKTKLIEQLKKDPAKSDVTYEIIEVKDKKDTSATVVVKITEKGSKEAETVPFPVTKTGSKWMVNFASMMDMEMPAIETPVKETPVIEEKGKDETTTDTETTTDETKVEEGKDKEPTKDDKE